MSVPAECPQCEKHHWVESENYPGNAALPVLTLCPACRATLSNPQAVQDDATAAKYLMEE